MNVYYDEEAERNLLGMAVIDNDIIDKASKLKADDFYINKNGKLWEVIKKLNEDHIKVDLFSLSNKASENGINDPVYIASLTDSVVSTANVQFYIDKIKDCSVRRKTRLQIKEVIEQVENSRNDGVEVAAKAADVLQKISESGDISEYKDSKTSIKDFIDRVENAYEHRGEPDNRPRTGLENIDKIIKGFENTDFAVIGARPSVGKTALMLNIISDMAFRQKLSVGILSLEMTEKSLVDRIASADTGIYRTKLKTGFMAKSDLDKLLEFSEKYYESKIFIDDSTNLAIEDIRTRARKMVKQDGIKILFIDHFSLISYDQRKQRWEAFAGISKSLKALTKEIKIPIVLLCQLSRDSEGREPQLSDLRETGTLEQDADIVAFLHRKRAMDGETEIPSDFMIVKNREGATGRARLNFYPNITKFNDLKDEQKDEEPEEKKEVDKQHNLL